MKESGFIFAVGAAITWGLVYTLDQKILLRLSPLGLLFVNSVLSLVATAPFLAWRLGEVGRLFTTTRTHLLLVGGSLLLGVLANYLIYSAIRAVGASTASSFEITYPFFVVAFSAALLGEQVNGPFVAGTLLIFAGVFLILKWGS